MTSLEEAIAKRDKFLEEHPHLQEMQKEIDRVLDATPADKRAEVLCIMLEVHAKKIREKFLELEKLLPA